MPPSRYVGGAFAEVQRLRPFGVKPIGWMCAAASHVTHDPQGSCQLGSKDGMIAQVEQVFSR